MGSNYTMRYDVDIVMCIDATASMGPFLKLVKNQAKNIYGDIQKKMQEKDKYINEFRVRVIVFRDYLADGKDAMLATEILRLPEQEEEFCRLINSIEYKGGGDAPEDGLEALGYAIKTQWNEQQGNKRRQIIVVWTDDGTHELGYGKEAVVKNEKGEVERIYPSNMAKNFAELTQWWGYGQMPGFMDNDAKRLLIYAPLKDYWTTIAETWDNALLFESEAGKGLDEYSYNEILDAIANSI